MVRHLMILTADTPVKKQAVAEARVMRAWAHMLAAQVYKCPPLVDHLLVDEKPTNAESQKAILDWCVKECEEAMTDLPDRKGKSDKEGAWRVTKGFAQFVAGKSALFAGDNAKCVEVMKPLVESPNYALVPGERFRDLFHVEGDGCEEKIFEFNYITNTDAAGSCIFPRDGWWQTAGHPLYGAWRQWSALYPTVLPWPAKPAPCLPCR